MTNPENGSRFNREFTPDDLAIVNLGYWDPNADDDTGSAASAPIEFTVEPAAESVEPDTEAAGEPGEPEAAGDPDSSEAPQEPAHGTEKSPVKIPAGGPSTAPSVAVDPDAEFSRVEAIPGGVKSAIEAILTVAEAPVSVREHSAALIVSERSNTPSISCTVNTMARKRNTVRMVSHPNRADSSYAASPAAGSSTHATTSPPGWRAS